MTSTVPTDEPILTGVSFGMLSYTLVLHYDRDLPRDWAQTVRSVLDTPPASAKNETGIEPAVRDAMRLDHIKKLERRIHNQRASNRVNWEIVEMRAKTLGSKASREAYIRRLKEVHELKAQLAEIIRQRDGALAKVGRLLKAASVSHLPQAPGVEVTDEMVERMRGAVIGNPFNDDQLRRMLQAALGSGEGTK